MEAYWRNEEYHWPGISEEVWAQVRKQLPRPPKTPRRKKDRKGGRPRASDRRSFGAILWMVRSGRQWRELPERFGSPRTALRRLASWSRSWRLEALFRAYLDAADDKEVLRWAEIFHANRTRRWVFWLTELEYAYRYHSRAERLGLRAAWGSIP